MGKKNRKNQETQDLSAQARPAGDVQPKDINQDDGQRRTDGFPSDIPNEVTLDDLAQYLRLVSEKSFDGEMSRRQSMLDTSNRLLTCDSIISVALVSVLPTMLSQFSDGEDASAAIILVFSFTALAFMIASLGVGLFAQYRFTYRALERPSKLENDIWESRNKLKTKYQIAWQYSNTLDIVQGSLVAVNNKLGKLNKLALVLLGIALGIALFTCIIFLILLLA